MAHLGGRHPRSPALSEPHDLGLPRVVLDTNAWLDLLLFEDPRIGRLGAAMRRGELLAITDGDCRDEWLRVLAYPQLRLDPARRLALAAAFDLLAHRASAAPANAVAPRLPRCSDPDDQKFLQLALDSGARWLISRDRAVLALGRRTQRAGWFQIVTPQAWAVAPAAAPFGGAT